MNLLEDKYKVTGTENVRIDRCFFAYLKDTQTERPVIVKFLLTYKVEMETIYSHGSKTELLAFDFG